MKDIKTRVLETLKNSKSLETDVQAVENNIADPTTHATNTRRIAITVVIVPTTERDVADIRIETKTALARRTVLEDQVTLGNTQALPYPEKEQG